MQERVLCLMILLIGGAQFSLGQTAAELEAAYEKKYQQRIQKDHLYGVYIPADLADALNQLNKLITPDARKSFIAHSEEEASRKLHFSFGRWMMYNWGFYEGSRLSHSLKETFGVSYPDDQARFILVAYHRMLRQAPLELDSLAQSFVDKREEDWQKRLEGGEVIYQQKVDSIPRGKGK